MSNEREKLTENAPENLTEASPTETAKLAGGRTVPTILPGIIAIALYMLVLGAVVTFGVVGNQYPKPFLLIAAAFVAASFGLLRMLRWAWALTLAAVFLLMSYMFWQFSAQKQAPFAVQGVLNLVFFLYLVRVDVRARLK